MAYVIRSASAPTLVLPSFTAKLLPSGGLVGNKPYGSIAEGIALVTIVCLFAVGGEGLTVITFVLPIESTWPR